MAQIRHIWRIFNIIRYILPYLANRTNGKCGLIWRPHCTKRHRASTAMLQPHLRPQRNRHVGAGVADDEFSATCVYDVRAGDVVARGQLRQSALVGREHSIPKFFKCASPLASVTEITSPSNNTEARASASQYFSKSLHQKASRAEQLSDDGTAKNTFQRYVISPRCQRTYIAAVLAICRIDRARCAANHAADVD